MGLFSLLNRRGLPIERVTGGLGITDTNHSQVHAKKAFEFCYSKQLTAGSVMALSIQVPASAYVHFQAARLIYAGAIKFEFIEGSTFSGGSAVTATNKNRVLPVPASVLTIKKDITNITGGTKLLDDLFIGFPGQGGGNARAAIGGATGDDSEWVLAQEQTYIIRITSLESSVTINVGLVPFWYEEDGY